MDGRAPALTLGSRREPDERAYGSGSRARRPTWCLGGSSDLLIFGWQGELAWHEACLPLESPDARAHRMTLLAALVSTSQRVGATSARLSKVRELAAALRALERDEIEIAVQYLSGDVPQGKFGVSYAMLQSAAQAPAALDSTLTIAETDRRLAEI